MLARMTAVDPVAGGPPPKAALPPVHVALLTLAIAAALAGVVLAFMQLAPIGFTWDEYVDWLLSVDYVAHHSFLSNLDDPSQARLSHIVGAAFMAVLGTSYVAYKIPFILIGIGSSAWLWWFLRARTGTLVASVTTAYYLTCPYVLAAERSAATAGDVLVATSTLAVMTTLVLWAERPRLWNEGIVCAVMAGLSVASKWTAGVVLPFLLIYWLLRPRDGARAFRRGHTWIEVVVFVAVAGAVAVIGSPTFLHGPGFVRSALAQAAEYDHYKLRLFGVPRAREPWFYLPAILISKFSPVVLAGALGWLVRRLLTRRKDEGLRLVGLIVCVPVAPLLSKGFQNAHYYVVLIAPLTIWFALEARVWLEASRVAVRNAAAAILAAGLIAQVGLVIWLAPDFLQAGRQFGRSFQAEFAGPAVNHCQGAPRLIEELLKRPAPGAPRVVYVLGKCLDLWNHAAAHGPVPAAIRFQAFYGTGRPPLPYDVVESGSFDYDCSGVAECQRYDARKVRAIDHCSRYGAPSFDWTIYRCTP